MMSARRRSRRIDWLLLATLLPVCLATQLGQIQAYRASGERIAPLRLSGDAWEELAGAEVIVGV